MAELATTLLSLSKDVIFNVTWHQTG
jgi:hypothetical protein